MNRTVAYRFFDNQQITGEVGIEIELEGTPLPTTVRAAKDTPNYWRVETDGSLRGEAREYVLDNPIHRNEINPALSQLYTALKKATLEDSGRAGVHVHINVRDLTFVQMYNFVMLYLVFEKVLVKFCGESREGNLFCLRSVDAEYLLYLLIKVIRNGSVGDLGTNEIRYASINLTALRKYGSLEFRAMRSPVEQEVIEDWAGVLLQLKDSALTFTQPEELLIGVSEMGGYDFARRHLGDYIRLFPDTNWNKEVMDGLRLIQPIVKALSEMSKKPVEEEKRPKEYTRVQIDPARMAAMMAAGPFGDWANQEIRAAAPAPRMVMEEWPVEPEPDPAQLEAVRSVGRIAVKDFLIREHSVHVPESFMWLL